MRTCARLRACVRMWLLLSVHTCVRACVCVCGVRPCYVCMFYLCRMSTTNRALVDTSSLEVCFAELSPVESPASVHQRETQVARTYQCHPPVVANETYLICFYLTCNPIVAFLLVVDFMLS